MRLDIITSDIFIQLSSFDRKFRPKIFNRHQKNTQKYEDFGKETCFYIIFQKQKGSDVHN